MSFFGFHDLLPHPDAPGIGIHKVRAQIVDCDSKRIIVEFYVIANRGIALPQMSNPERKDGLWQTTCFELFLMPDASAVYYEFNFSPSGEWAAYQFFDYREGMRDLDLDIDPHIEVKPTDEGFNVAVAVEVNSLPFSVGKLALSAVIEERDGTKSYWALRHPPGKPDFHHPDCFALTLPAPG